MRIQIRDGSGRGKGCFAARILSIRDDYCVEGESCGASFDTTLNYVTEIIVQTDRNHASKGADVNRGA
jgi:hypothetical protein